MEVVLDCLSRLTIYTSEYRNFLKHKRNPQARPASSGCSPQAERSDWPKYAAAYERVEYVRKLYTQDLSTLGFKIVFFDDAEAEALQRTIDQCWAIMRTINDHGGALQRAFYTGRDIDFDSKFWREHEELVR